MSTGLDPDAVAALLLRDALVADGNTESNSVFVPAETRSMITSGCSLGRPGCR